MMLIPSIVSLDSGGFRVTLNDVDTEHGESGQWCLQSDIEWC